MAPTTARLALRVGRASHISGKVPGDDGRAPERGHEILVDEHKIWVFSAEHLEWIPRDLDWNVSPGPLQWRLCA